MFLSFFFFNDTATTEIYTLSLHDALPISGVHQDPSGLASRHADASLRKSAARGDRKSTRLNSSHGYISYAVFCLKKKKNIALQNDLLVERQHLGVLNRAIMMNVQPPTGRR